MRSLDGSLAGACCMSTELVKFFLQCHYHLKQQNGFQTPRNSSLQEVTLLVTSTSLKPDLQALKRYSATANFGNRLDSHPLQASRFTQIPPKTLANTFREVKNVFIAYLSFLTELTRPKTKATCAHCLVRCKGAPLVMIETIFLYHKEHNLLIPLSILFHFIHFCLPSLLPSIYINHNYTLSACSQLLRMKHNFSTLISFFIVFHHYLLADVSVFFFPVSPKLLITQGMILFVFACTFIISLFLIVLSLFCSVKSSHFMLGDKDPKATPLPSELLKQKPATTTDTFNYMDKLNTTFLKTSIKGIPNTQYDIFLTPISLISLLLKSIPVTKSICLLHTNMINPENEDNAVLIWKSITHFFSQISLKEMLDQKLKCRLIEGSLRLILSDIMYYPHKYYFRSKTP
ncbi:hypothetical protein VP01_909g4 [Puccinia sorghi]|uniref:Uncharacterized protein n=1 Tax=Puccinia sorghi TaxID=27349 RepID=A0A0L6U885_9BASI|nr:hypothetical protein VP01_909g4 [Puccinia sorghi]